MSEIYVRAHIYLLYFVIAEIEVSKSYLRSQLNEVKLILKQVELYQSIAVAKVKCFKPIIGKIQL